MDDTTAAARRIDFMGNMIPKRRRRCREQSGPHSLCAARGIRLKTFVLMSDKPKRCLDDVALRVIAGAPDRDCADHFSPQT
jgi:hypothetical protein